MILKGNQRAGGADLATHLMNEFDNEFVEVAEIRGTVAQDLHGAFGEYEAVAAGTRCKEPLYSLSINPSAPISRDQYRAAIDRIEQRLGLSGQARAVVFHVKHGREHCHVVWSRIDTARMRAVQLSHDRQKLRKLAQELAHEFGLKLPDGLAQDRDDDQKRKRDVNLAEKAQAEETGITPAERRTEITDAFRRSDSAEAFRAALKEKGYVLAQGDKRSYVVVDRFGKVHSLARQIDGIKTKELKDKLASIPPEQLPSVEEAAAAIRQKGAERRERVDLRVSRRMAELSEKLAASQTGRRRKLDLRKQEIATVHAAERMSLHAMHKSEAGAPFARVAGAIFALFDRVPGLRSVIAPLRRNPKINPAERHRIEREALERRHQREQFLLERRHRALHRLDVREQRSLETKIRREIELAESLQADASQERLHQVEVNKFDITLPADELAAESKQAPAKGWKKRQDKLSSGSGQTQNRPRGYRQSREE
ncbi:Relaxase/mobilization nuclease family protein [Rhizobium etli CNPAF512]|nr:Relaxase/mobilization nuclease family protein [Rhizobium etli CNPAF512]